VSLSLAQLAFCVRLAAQRVVICCPHLYAWHCWRVSYLSCPDLPACLYLPACLPAASDQFAALDIKSIQHDSMTGHWLLPLLGGSGGVAAGAGDAELRR
jgi:hypothetical protein